MNFDETLIREGKMTMFAFHGCEGDLAAALDAQV